MSIDTAFDYKRLNRHRYFSFRYILYVPVPLSVTFIMETMLISQWLSDLWLSVVTQGSKFSFPTTPELNAVFCKVVSVILKSN